MYPDIRDPQESEIAALARLWHDGWHDAHTALVPKELTSLRTTESFVERIGRHIPDTRVFGNPGSPLGLCVTLDNEMYQLYVAREARGKGVAAMLIADAEERLAARGYKTAWLACAIGNLRAARFYEKCGWRLDGPRQVNLETPRGSFALEIWRYEKRLAG